MNDLEPLSLTAAIAIGSLLSFAGGLLRCRRLGCPWGDAVTNGLCFASVGITLGFGSAWLLVEWRHQAGPHLVACGLGLLPWLGAELVDILKKIREPVIEAVSAWIIGILKLFTRGK